MTTSQRPPGREKRRTLLVVAAAVALITIVIVILRTRGGDADRAAAGVASATAGASVPRSHPRVGAPQRVYPTGGEVHRLDEAVMGTLEGRVVSVEGGQPIPSAEITFVGPGGARSTKTDASGQFVFQPDREGLYEVTLITCVGFVSFAPELGSSPMSWTAQRGVGISGLTFRLESLVQYLGVVLDPRDQPVPQADIQIFDAENVEFALAGFSTRLKSDDRGEFRFNAPDDAIVEARHASFAPGRAAVGFATRIGKRLTVKMGPLASAAATGTIRGVVIDTAGTSLADVAVSATVETDNPESEAAQLNPGGGTRTDARGAFVIERLTEGTYTVRASDGDHAPTAAWSVRTGGAPVTLVLANGASLTGRVTDQATGAPISAVSIVVSERRGPLLTRTVKTATVFDADGRYALRHIAKGTYLVTVVAEGYAPAPDREVAVEGDAVADFVLSRGAKLVGLVRSAKTKAPIERAKVSLDGQHGSSAGTASLSPPAVTDRDGRFELLGVGPGARSFLAAAPGHHGRVLGGLVFTAGETVGPVEIALTPLDKDEDPKIELTGIGAALTPKDDVLVFGKVFPGGGAAEAGLVPGDALLSIDGVAIVDLGFEGAIGRIRGPEGTTVSFVVRRASGGEPTVLVVKRTRIKG